MADAVRFIHSADLHLDAPFQGVDATDERVRQTLIASTYEAFGRVVDACLEHEAHFLVVAGDVFNSRDKSLRAQLAFHAQVERLHEASIPVFVAHGNHDPADGWSAQLKVPENLTYFPTDSVGRFEVVRDGEILCGVYGRSFRRSAETSNLARTFSREPADTVCIGVLHANVGGNTDHEPYAPCSVDDLRAADMDYWALGHVHKPGRVSDDPRVIYPGSPQGLNPKESGTHGCYVVEIAGGVATEEFVPTASVEWARVEVNAERLETIGDIADAVRRACESLRAQSAVPVIVRVDLSGRSTAHAELARGTNLEELVADLRDEQLSAEPWLWLDRVRDMSSPTIDLDEVRAAPDFAGDLVRIADELISDDAQAESLLRDVIGPFESSMGVVELGMGPSEVLERARDLCLDKLLEGAEGR